MRTRRSKIDTDELIRLYTVEKLSSEQISEKLKIHISSVRKKLIANGFQKGKRLDITNEKYGRLTAIERFRERGDTYWLCKCNCGNFKKIRLQSLRNGDTKSCGCITREVCESRRDKPSKSYIATIRIGAIKRKIHFDISVEDILNQFEKQKGKCYYTKTKIFFHADISRFRHKQTASVDRIDSSKGYTKDNIVIVHKAINKMKAHYSHEEFIHFCGLVSKNHIVKKQEAFDLLSKATYQKTGGIPSSLAI